MFKGYGAVFKQILKSKAMVKALTLQAILGVIMLMTSTFFALYATQNLHIPEGLLAIFPILRAGVMLSFLLVLQSKLSKYKLQNIMLCGIVLYASAMAWLLIAPENNSVWLGVYVIMEACAAALLLPRLETLAANSIDKQERARIRSLFNMVIIAVSSPFGIFAGVLSDINRRLPFILSLVLFLCMIVVVVAGLRDKGEEIAENP
jgi:predicted acyltransferase